MIDKLSIVCYDIGRSSLVKGFEGLRTVKTYDERRREIIQIAKELFLQYGTEHTPVSRLIKEIGVAHGLFYYYFKSKEEVVDAVIDSMLDDVANALTEKLDAVNGDSFTCLAALINAIFDVYANPMIHLELSNQFYCRYHDQIVDVMYRICKTCWDKCIHQEALAIQHSQKTFQIILSGSLYLIRKNQITREGLMDLAVQMLNIPQDA